MRHRIASNTGLGNPDKALLDNKGKINKKFADAAIVEYFSKWEGFDFHVDKKRVTVGIEPTYQFDPLKIVSIHKDKSKSFTQTGRAWGYYGSKITSTTKTYSEYKYKSKFIRFVDEWHEKLFGVK